jgi:UMF1 family MFS transporter
MTQTAEALDLNRGAKPLVGYCLFDFANSAFTTIVITFVFATYFAQGVAASPDVGAGQWSLAMSLAGICIALLSPFVGAIADQTGRRKAWIFAVSLVCVAATAGLWFVRPQASDVPLALGLVVIATIGFEIGMLFYNSLLPTVATPERIGRVSGWAWGTGYLGGLIALVVALIVLVQAKPAPFGLDEIAAGPVRATSILVAVWFVIFAAPLFLFVREPRSATFVTPAVIRNGLRQVIDSLRHARQYKNVFRYLIAGMIYSDAVTTIFSLGGVYAGVTFGMKTEQIIILGIALNVTAGAGAFLGGWVDDKLGSKRTIILSLVALIVTASATILATTTTQFWIAALAMSTFFGPVQAASRTLMAKLAPEEIRSEMFGLFALSGKVTAFVGPAVVGWITLATGSYRAGMGSVILFLIIGLLLMRRVEETKNNPMDPA